LRSDGASLRGSPKTALPQRYPRWGLFLSRPNRAYIRYRADGGLADASAEVLSVRGVGHHRSAARFRFIIRRTEPLRPLWVV